MVNIPKEIVDFITKWAVATDQKPEIASKRFWDLMISNDISDDGKEETLNKWVEEAGYDFRGKRNS